MARSAKTMKIDMSFNEALKHVLSVAPMPKARSQPSPGGVERSRLTRNASGTR
jgi:hypothetical protein